MERSERPCAPPEECDLAVIGGGIIGLAVARELAARRPRSSVCLLEREPELASQQSGRNSGVVHSGVYYAPGSLKARLCVTGARELLEYCDRRGLRYVSRGKLIVATGTSELPRLDELERRGRANGVPGLRRVAASEIPEFEPHARGLAALHCPSTAVVDFAAVARSYAADLRDAGGAIATGCEVAAVSTAARTIDLRHSRGTTRASYTVFCAGAWADLLAVAAGAAPDPRIIPFRGTYMRLRPHRRELVRGLIYPVPDPSLPFLGVHLTRTIDDEILLGPSALLAGGRDARRRRNLRADVVHTLTWGGTWRMAARHWRTGATELRSALVPREQVRAARRYLPGISFADVGPGFAGVRAQAVARDGRLLDDFSFSATPRALHVRNAPSPGATSSLTIARHIADEAGRAFDI